MRKPQTVTSAFRSHPLIAFFVLTFALSWWPTPLYVAGVPPFFPDLPFLGAGPLLASLIVTSIATGRAGLRELGARMIRWRIGWHWYAAALGIPLGVAILTMAFSVALGAPITVLAQLPPFGTLLFVFTFRLISPLNGPLGEEPGWRGFALPRLQGSGRSPLRASLILALLVAAWHLPEVLVTQRLPPVGLLGAFAVTFWYNWLFNRAAGSVFITLVMHAAEGTFGPAVLSVFQGADFARAFSIYVAVTCVVAVGLVVLDRKVWLGPAVAETDDAGSTDLQRIRGTDSSDAPLSGP
jgi:hypothetical protein